jgi:hypothetical protein
MNNFTVLALGGNVMITTLGRIIKKLKKVLISFWHALAA